MGTKSKKLMNELQVHKAIDKLQAAIEECPPANCPVNHIFTPMLYTRTIFMPGGTLIVSKIHKFQHPYFILSGIAWVKINEGKWERLQAPYIGITEPGTRRVLYIEKDCIWATSHAGLDIWPDDESDEAVEAAVRKIEDIIIERRENLIFNEETLLQ
jgi:hypothetical protein